MILAFDTSGAHCAAALLAEGHLRAAAAEDMTRGQAERLMPMLEEVLKMGAVRWSGITTLGVGIGPGNFTGIRLAISAARGLSLGLNVPAIGINTFDAIALDHANPVLATVKAPRDQLYVQAPGTPPTLVSEDRAAEFGLPIVKAGNPARLAENIARLAKRQRGTSPPVPLYIRPADAAPSRVAAPQLLDDES